MSQENVETVRQAFAGFAKHGIEGVLPFNSPDVVTYSMPEWPDDPSDAGDSVVALLDMTGLVKGSEIRVYHQLGSVHSGFRAGAMDQVRYFASWQAALEAAGLRE